eukprot:TRINITY_DN18409_c0_g1_i7.p1 TRINITY_DN18409_c0_g1~~TRINITY_DN18409_c0_g1_i7.p1  ORF type:complete len:328 (+),score=39.30 TRINITY_DN18409_c0_g1_i7:44-985(+)
MIARSSHYLRDIRPHLRRCTTTTTSASAAVNVGPPKKVLVTGASGKTGSLVFKKLLEQPQEFSPTALVRSEKSKNKLQKNIGGEYEIVVNDIVNGGSVNLQDAFQDCWGVIIVTAATPKLSVLSLFSSLWAKFVAKEKKMPKFTFPDMPEKIDWQGAKAQIDCAKQAGVSRVVLVSSMGVTDAFHPLNAIADGNILLWKRKAEEYLIRSGLNYTILHPGGLKDTEGGKNQIEFGVDDELLKREQKGIPREDVAEVVVQSLKIKQAENRSIDLVAITQKESDAPTDVEDLFTKMSLNCKYAPMEEKFAAEILAA